MVHEAVAGKLHTLQSHRNMDIVKPWRQAEPHSIKSMHEKLANKSKIKSKYVPSLPSQKALPEWAVLGGQFRIFRAEEFSQQLYNS